ncbi:hypothetical protein NQ317_014646 [Molorchus minor]|uniref:Uncharacterized protein n=1 Tax=Molorchus minor TaxID=1323400 RepID=A0ABQ9JPF0_9CUCU|nr:hypothetical protein NQ317_014646 [Molorchus minor]
MVKRRITDRRTTATTTASCKIIKTQFLTLQIPPLLQEIYPVKRQNYNIPNNVKQWQPVNLVIFNPGARFKVLRMPHSFRLPIIVHQFICPRGQPFLDLKRTDELWGQFLREIAGCIGEYKIPLPD